MIAPHVKTVVAHEMHTVSATM